jgi:hypothetical protein
VLIFNLASLLLGFLRQPNLRLIIAAVGFRFTQPNLRLSTINYQLLIMSSILDLTNFPIVRMQVDDRTLGGTQAWIAEMEALLAREEPFAIIAGSRVIKDSPEDEQMRGDWYRTNDRLLAQWCKMTIYVEPDAVARERLQSQAAGLRRVFSFAFEVVADDRTALDLAHRSLV